MIFKCIICGKDIIDCASSKRKICSDECNYAYKIKIARQQRIKFENLRKTQFYKRVCKFCEIEFTTPKKSKKYCTYDCAHKSYRVEGIKYGAEYYKNHKTEINKRRAKHYQENKERISISNAKRYQEKKARIKREQNAEE
jgi:hypothetical protein